MAEKRGCLDALWRWLVFVLLVPVVAAEAWALVVVLGAEGREALESRPSAGVLWLAGGAAGYVLVHLILHKPITTYVFGHELTHALWAVLTGHRVGRIRVGAESGQVETAGTNWLIRLAPYFCPLYSLILLGGWALAALCWPELNGYRGALLAGLGFTYAFHVFLTVHSLRGGQGDLKAEGYCFSLALIAAVNLQIMAALVAAASRAVGWWEYEQLVGQSLVDWTRWAAKLIL